MDIIESFRQSIEYIEANLEKELTIKEIAKSAYMSSFYFQRTFAILSGMSVMDYVRNRRLSNAGEKLLHNPKIRIIDLAIDSMYDSPESFSRAFKRFHGVLPSEVKRKNKGLVFFPRLEIVINIKGGKIMDYKIEQDKEYTIVIIKKIFNEASSKKDIPQFWNEYNKKGYSRVVPPMLGICFPTKKDDEFEYGIGSVIECVASIPEGFVTIKVPKQTYVKFKAIGPMPSALQELWKKVMTEWLPNAPYELVEAPEFECYSEGDISSKNYESFIWLPVRKK